MEQNVEPNKFGKIHTCLVCGYKDTEEYCSKCGAKLYLFDEGSSPIRNFILIPKEFFLEVVNPIFAFIKTTWLLITTPEIFFSAIFRYEIPVTNLSFPLENLWKSLTKKEQYFLDPIKFFLVMFTIFYFIPQASKLGLGEATIEQKPSSIFSDQLLILIWGLMFLIIPILISFLFDILTRGFLMPSRFKYQFWMYVFSLTWLFELGNLLTGLPFLPVLFALKILNNIDISRFPSSIGSIIPISMGFGAILLIIINNSGKALTIITLLFYIFWVLPLVFDRLYKIPTNKLPIATLKYVLVIIFAIIFISSTNNFGLAGCLPIFFALLLFGTYLFYKVGIIRDIPKDPNRSTNSESITSVETTNGTIKVNNLVTCPNGHQEPIVQKISDLVKHNRKYLEDIINYSNTNNEKSIYKILKYLDENINYLYPPAEPKKPEGLGFWKIPIILYGIYLFLSIGASIFLSIILLGLIFFSDWHDFYPNITISSGVSSFLFISAILLSFIISLIISSLFLRFFIKLDKKKKNETQLKYEKAVIDWGDKIRNWEMINYCLYCEKIFIQGTNTPLTAEEINKLL